MTLSGDREYKFTVIRQDRRFDYGIGDYVALAPELWHVQLPHQCSEWKIAGKKYGDGVSHAEAVEALEAFIAQAQDALLRLRAKETDEEYY